MKDRFCRAFLDPEDPIAEGDRELLKQKLITPGGIRKGGTIKVHPGVGGMRTWKENDCISEDQAPYHTIHYTTYY